MRGFEKVSVVLNNGAAEAAIAMINIMAENNYTLRKDDGIVKGIYNYAFYTPRPCYGSNLKATNLYHSHGATFDKVFNNACCMAYEYVKGAYGLGYANWYTFEEILVTVEKGHYEIIGNPRGFRDTLIISGKCPESWGTFQMVFEGEELLLKSNVVGVANYESSEKARCLK